MIGVDSEQLGIMPPSRAIELAQQAGLDLVEISPTAVPPVCRIMDFGKFLYERNKQAHAAKRKQRQFKVKEVKFRPGVDEHDYNFKRNNIIRFLQHGDKVKASVFFRGREVVHPELGRKVLERLISEVREHGVVETVPLREGNTMITVLAPAPRKVGAGAPATDRGAPPPPPREGGPQRRDSGTPRREGGGAGGP